jgi:hypothetical protein
LAEGDTPWQLRTYALSRLSQSYGRSAAEAAAAQFCALKMLLLQQSKSESEHAGLRSDVRQVCRRGPAARRTLPQALGLLFMVLTVIKALLPLDCHSCAPHRHGVAKTLRCRLTPNFLGRIRMASRHGASHAGEGGGTHPSRCKQGSGPTPDGWRWYSISTSTSEGLAPQPVRPTAQVESGRLSCSKSEQAV